MKLTNFFVVKMRCKNILFVKKKWKTSEYMDPPIKVLHMAKLQTTRFVWGNEGWVVSWRATIIEKRNIYASDSYSKFGLQKKLRNPIRITYLWKNVVGKRNLKWKLSHVEVDICTSKLGTLSPYHLSNKKIQTNLILVNLKNPFCRLLSTFGDFWRLLATCGNLWRHVVTCGNLWKLLATFDNFWQLLAPTNLTYLPDLPTWQKKDIFFNSDTIN